MKNNNGSFLVSPVSCKTACTQEVIEELQRREQAKEKLQKKKLIKEKAVKWGFSATIIEDEIWPPKKPKNRAKKSTPGLNRTNENIEWAKWSWNPVTGCKHGCKYCYARDIAERFYEEKFEPTFRPERLEAIGNLKEPNGDIGEKSVFVCSMADLFGDWVPQEWIDAVLETIQKAPKWNFLFLTKNPSRLVDIKWPDNAWVGTTVDVQKRVLPAEEAFKEIQAKVKFISCEPLTEPIQFNHLEYFNWLIIGSRSRSKKMPAYLPEPEWVISLWQQCLDAGFGPYFKPNTMDLVKSYP